MWPKRAGTAAAALAVLLLPSLAQAYCRTMACSKTNPELMCTLDENGCPVNDLPLYWATSCISFGVQQDASKLRQIDYDTAHRIVVDSFETWMSADCGGGSRPYIEIVDYGQISCSQLEYNTDQPNANVIMFRDDRWPHKNADDTLALTTITFNVDSGEIYDADIEVNSVEYPLTVADIDPLSDLQSILTHEVGHFLGLGHSNVADASMAPKYPSETLELRTLDADDVAGICAIYRPSLEIPPAECTPRHGFSVYCAKEDEQACTTSAPGRGREGAALAFGLVALAAVLRRRRQGAGG